MKAQQNDSIDINEELAQAVIGNDLPSLETLIEENPITMMTVLESSIRYHKTEIFKFLLEKCQRESRAVKIWEISSIQKQSFLNIAAATKNLEIVQYLVEQQATPIIMETTGVAGSYRIQRYLERHFLLQKIKEKELSLTKLAEEKQREERSKTEAERNKQTQQLWLGNFLDAVYNHQIKTPQEAETIILQLPETQINLLKSKAKALMSLAIASNQIELANVFNRLLAPEIKIALPRELGSQESGFLSRIKRRLSGGKKSVSPQPIGEEKKLDYRKYTPKKQPKSALLKLEFHSIIFSNLPFPIACSQIVLIYLNQLNRFLPYPPEIEEKHLWLSEEEILKQMRSPGPLPSPLPLFILEGGQPRALSGVNFSGRIFSPLTEIKNCDLSETKFRKAVLPGMAFRHCAIGHTDFSSAELSNSWLDILPTSASSFCGANLTNTILIISLPDNCSLPKLDFTEAKLLQTFIVIKHPVQPSTNNNAVYYLRNLKFSCEYTYCLFSALGTHSALNAGPLLDALQTASPIQLAQVHNQFLENLENIPVKDIFISVLQEYLNEMRKETKLNEQGTFYIVKKSTDMEKMCMNLAEDLLSFLKSNDRSNLKLLSESCEKFLNKETGEFGKLLGLVRDYFGYPSITALLQDVAPPRAITLFAESSSTPTATQVTSASHVQPG